MDMDDHQFPVDGSLASRVRGFLSPGGRFENSPAVHCRVQIGESTSPEGTAETSQCLWSIAIPILVEVIQPSLRDSTLLVHRPTLERVGYYQFSLREKAKERPELFGHRTAKQGQTSPPRYQCNGLRR